MFIFNLGKFTVHVRQNLYCDLLLVLSIIYMLHIYKLIRNFPSSSVMVIGSSRKYDQSSACKICYSLIV